MPSATTSLTLPSDQVAAKKEIVKTREEDKKMFSTFNDNDSFGLSQADFSLIHN